MSESALLDAVVRKLKAAVGSRDDASVGRTPGGKPSPHCGDWFIGVAEEGFANTDTNPLSLDERYSVLVVITFKMAYAPKQSLEEEFDKDGHMRPLTRTILTALHGNYDVLNWANEAIGDDQNGFVEPLSFLTAGPVQSRGADWVWASDEGHPPSVYVRELRFGGARRVQTLESQA